MCKFMIVFCCLRIYTMLMLFYQSNKTRNNVTDTSRYSVVCDMAVYVVIDDDDADDDDDEEEEEGWITPGNIEAMKQATIALTQSETTELPVACVTTDYAMQVSCHAAAALYID